MIKGLPDRLKKLRIQHRYSQKDIALKINVSPAIISAYETGERTPSTEKILALAKLFHCSTDFLLGHVKNTETDAVLDVHGLTDKQLQALQVVVDGMR